jgi:hypothetical protein
MITKEQAIEILDSETSLIAVEKLKYYAGFNQDKVVELIQEAMNMGAEALKGKDTNVPSKWIPCSERLPEDGQTVIFTAKEVVDDNGNKFVEAGVYEKEKGWCYNDGYFPNAFTFTAWMPLPEPYKESED